MATRDQPQHVLRSGCDEAAKIQWTLVDDDSIAESVRPNALNNLGQTIATRPPRYGGGGVRAVELFLEDFTSLANLLIARRTLCSVGDEDTAAVGCRGPAHLLDERFEERVDPPARCPVAATPYYVLQYVDWCWETRGRGSDLQSFVNARPGHPHQRRTQSAGYLSFDLRSTPWATPRLTRVGPGACPSRRIIIRKTIYQIIGNERKGTSWSCSTSMPKLR